MKLEINHNSCIRNIQQDFHQEYPYLKMEFFSTPHQLGEMCTDGFQYDPGFCLAHIVKRKEQACLDIHPWQKTGDVEQAFRERFGLYVQIYRKENGRWIQTAGTDLFSLEEQNLIGKNLEEKREGNLWVEREKLL